MCENECFSGEGPEASSGVHRGVRAKKKSHKPCSDWRKELSRTCLGGWDKSSKEMTHQNSFSVLFLHLTCAHTLFF